MALYDDVVKIAKEYVGPAGQKFVDRQISGHLGVSPSEINSENMAELAKWCLSSGKMLIGDDKAKEFSEKVKALG